MEDSEQTRTLLVAVVGNDASALHAIVVLVGSFRFVASKFASAAEFLRSLQAHKTACLIADMQMPGMTSPELHQHLASNGDASPTILTTACPNEATRIRALEAGVLCYLAKPVGLDDLLGCIRSALAQRA